MTTPRAVEERRLVDDVGAGAHRGERLGRGRAQLLAAVLDRAVELDRRPTVRPSARRSSRYRRSCSKPRLRMRSSSGSSRIGRVTRPASARAFQLDQVLAGEVADEVGGRVDGSAVDRLHGSTLPAARVSSPVTTALHSDREPGAAQSDTAGSSAGPGRASSSARSARPWRRVPSTTCRTRASGCRSRTIRPPATGRWRIGCCKDAGMAPPWIETDKEVRALLARRDAILERAPRASTVARPERDRRVPGGSSRRPTGDHAPQQRGADGSPASPAARSRRRARRARRCQPGGSDGA